MTREGPGPQARGIRGWLRACCRRNGWAFWSRVALLGLVLAAAAAAAYLNWIGLPDILKRPILAALREGGVELSFNRLRLSGLRGVVADGVQVSFASNPNSAISSKKAEIDLAVKSYWTMEMGLRGLRLSGAEFDLTSPGPSRQSLFKLERAAVNLEHQGAGRWQMLEFQAESMGWDVHAHGSLANISKLADLVSPASQTNQPAAASQFETQILPWLRTLEFDERPRLDIHLSGDAEYPAEIVAALQFTSRAVHSPSFNARQLQLFARTAANTPTNHAFVFGVEISGFESGVERVETLTLDGRITPPEGVDGVWVGSLRGAAEGVRSGAVQAANGGLRGLVELAPSSKSDSRLEFSIGLERLAAPEFSLARLDLTSKLSGRAPAQWSELLPRSHAAPTSAPPNLQEGAALAGSLAVVMDDLRAGELTLAKGGLDAGLNIPAELVWTPSSWTTTNLARLLRASGNVWAENLEAGKASLSTVEVAAQWKEAVLTVAHFQARSLEGLVEGNSAFDFNRRDVRFQLAGNLDPTALFSKWGSSAPWDKVVWSGSPYFDIKASLPFPTGDSWVELLAGVKVAASLEGGGAFDGVQVERARVELNLPSSSQLGVNVQLEHQGGKLSLNGVGDLVTGDWSATFRSGVDPMKLTTLMPVVPEELKQLSFGSPPSIEGRLELNTTNWAAIRFKGEVALTNASYKGEFFDLISASVDYQNRVANLDNLLIVRNPMERLEAPHARLDLPAEVFHLTNGLSTLNPYVITTLIGPKVYSAIEPYQFSSNPTVRINGDFPLDNSRTANIHFDIDGDGLRWWKLGFGKVAGHVYWKGFELWLQGVHAAFYEGEVDFEGYFKFREAVGDDSADFTMKAKVRESNLSPLMKDLADQFSSMEGTVNGELNLTSANSSDWSDWNGHGWAEMRDGFLWGTPLFGVFTPVLDSIMPGLGTSRISAARGDYTIEKSLVKTRNLEFRAPVFRLAYEGSVDFEGKLDARAEALMFRDTWVLGPVLSATLWPVAKVFETKIAGELANPKVEFAHIPKFVFLPLKPLQILKKLVPVPRPKPGVEGEAKPSRP